MEFRLDDQGDTYMNALNAIKERLDVLDSSKSSGQSSGGGDSKGKKGPRCFRCQGYGHIAANCGTPPPNGKN